jgi:putative ABC transport system ATP-binding protein
LADVFDGFDVHQVIAGYPGVVNDFGQENRTMGKAAGQQSDHGGSQVPAAAPVFIARGLSKVYGSGETQIIALRDVDLDIWQGEFLVLLGPSGSGKSTLLNILGGLDAATSGSAKWRDHELTLATDAELTAYRREHVGFVFQFYNLIPSLTVRENVKLVAEIATDPMPVERAVELVGLSHRLNHFPSQLSGGEQQRVAVARAIVKRPDLLLCDEPTGALDFDTGRLVLSAIQKVNAELGTTTVVITHNSAIAGMADRVLRLRGGQIAGEERNAKRLSAGEVTW